MHNILLTIHMLSQHMNFHFFHCATSHLHHIINIIYTVLCIVQITFANSALDRRYHIYGTTNTFCAFYFIEFVLCSKTCLILSTRCTVDHALSAMHRNLAEMRIIVRYGNSCSRVAFPAADCMKQCGSQAPSPCAAACPDCHANVT